MNISRSFVVRPVVVAVTAVGLALALGACSSGTPTPSSTSSSSGSHTKASHPSAAGAINSCTVLSQADISTALGESVQPGVRGKATVEGGVACVFYGPNVPEGTNPDVPIADSVRVVLVTGANAAKWYNDYKGKVRAVALSGLGDQAYYDGDASVSVLKGNDYLRVSVIRTSGISESAEETLARDALPLM